MTTHKNYVTNILFVYRLKVTLTINFNEFNNNNLLVYLKYVNNNNRHYERGNYKNYFLKFSNSTIIINIKYLKLFLHH